MARRRDDDDEDDDLPRKKAARRDYDEDEDRDEDLEPAATPAPNNAYTGILAISFVALVAAAVLFAMDASELGSTPIPQPSISVPGLGEEKQALPTGPGKQP
jgi:hypothetical protein